MALSNTYSHDQLRDYSSLFSRGEAQQWIKRDFASIDFKINRYDHRWLDSKDASYIDYLKHIYHVLESHYQNEYIFKNALINEIIIKEIGQSDSKIFNEFRLGKSVADLAVFNGTSKVFEIKTELDTVNRLASQIENYRKVFNEIYLVVPKAKLALYSGYDDIGVISFDIQRQHKFLIEKKAASYNNVESATLMQILHTNEYKRIVESYFGCLPEITSFNQFNKCFDLIRRIPAFDLNLLFIEQMKLRDISNSFSIHYHKEFNQLSIALRLTKRERSDMLQALKTPIKT